VGTRAQVHVEATQDRAVAKAAEDQVLAELSRLEAIFTTFDDTSPLRTGGLEVVELATVTLLAQRWCARTRAFNPRLHAVLELWTRAEAADEMPDPATIAAAVKQIQRDDEPFDNLNAIAKGWICQAAVETVTLGDTTPSVWLNLGGDIMHRGVGSLQVGIEDPHRPFDNVAPLLSVSLSNEALATSGPTRRWWTIAGNRFAKVVDPRTGMPVQRLSAATVIAPSAADADALATIALVADVGEVRELAQDVGAEYLLISNDGTQQCSGRFAECPSTQ